LNSEAVSAERPDTPVLCDAHVHLWADNPPLPEYVVAPGFAANVSALLANMDAHAIDQAAVVTPRAMGWDNGVTIEAARAHPGRIVAIGLVNPQASRPEEDLMRLIRSGFAGVRLSPFNEPEETWLAGTGLARLWETAGEDGFPVHLHIAPKQLPQVTAIAERFRNVPLVIDHLGRPGVEAGTDAFPFRAFLSLADYPNVWAKTPSSGFFSKSQPPFLDLVPFLQAAIDAYGSNRILWGSDWPGCLANASYNASYKDSLEPWYSHFPDLDAQGRANVFGLNFMQLYRRTTLGGETSL
jgi:predicted TIM-barrel fold metal-dependent hydrolase